MERFVMDERTRLMSCPPLRIMRHHCRHLYGKECYFFALFSMIRLNIFNSIIDIDEILWYLEGEGGRSL